MLSGAREAGCFREVAALHSDHLRQVSLYYACTHICFAYKPIPYTYNVIMHSCVHTWVVLLAGS